jgi:colanic acid biosynthesis glycosyl transferase WcaI
VKILLYSANYAPEPTGIGKYSGEMVEWLTKQGHEVRVVAAPPYYPDWKVAKGYSWPPYQKERIFGALVWRAPLWVPRQPGGLKRVLHLASFALTSMPLMLRQVAWKPDLVVTVAPAFVCAPMGHLTARLSQAKSWLHVQDFEVDVAFGMGFLKGGGLLHKFALAVERSVMKRFDVVSSISAKMVERLALKGVSPAATQMFPNWVNVNNICPLEGVSPYREALNIPAGAKVVLYSGTLGAKHGLNIIPEVAKHLAHRADVFFVICGEGVMKPELVRATQGMSNVRMLPLQPLEKLNELLGMANIHILPQCAGAEDLVLPSKMTGMLSSGRPVVATCTPDSELGRVVSFCGRVTPPGNVDALAQAIDELASSPELCGSLGVKARHYAEDFMSIDGVLEKFVTRAQRVVKQQAAGVDSIGGSPCDPVELNLFTKIKQDPAKLHK